MPIISISIQGRGGREFNAAEEGQAAEHVQIHRYVARHWRVRCRGGVGWNVAGSWWTEISVNYSTLNYLLIFAKWAIVWIVRDHGLFCFLPSLLVSYVPLAPLQYELLRWTLHPESQTAHTGKDINQHLTCPLLGINEKRKTQWNQFLGSLLSNAG